MTEKFDLKVASGLLPHMDNSEEVTLRLIEGIELYDSMLENAGKPLLTMYVLKTKLSQSAKLRLNKTYPSNSDLIKDMREKLIAKKSISGLSMQLFSAKQRNKSIQDFGRDIEELMLNLTIAQADGNDTASGILANTNEKLAISAFANGLRDENLRLITRARGFSTLAEAINGAVEESNFVKNSEQVFYTRDQNVRGQNTRGRNSFGNRQRNFRGNFHFGNNHGNRNVYFEQNRGQTRGRNNFRNSHRQRSGDSRSRGSYAASHSRQLGQAYPIIEKKEQEVGSADENQSEQSRLQFFRDFE